MAVVSCTWHKVKSIGDVPCARVGHSVTLLNESVYLFGGSRTQQVEDQLEYFNDLYKASSEDLLWERICTASAVIPRPRDSHATCFADKSLYLLGGKSQLVSDRCFSEVHCFDAEQKTWNQIKTSGPSPSAVGFSASTVRRKIFVFGGILGGCSVNDLSVLNLNELEWTPVKCNGEIPGPRCDHACEVMDDALYVFGGAGATDRFYNDLYCLNTHTLEWTNVKSRGITPAHRAGHSFVAHRDKDIYVWGGYNHMKEEYHKSTIQKFSLGKKKWKQPVTAGLSPPTENVHGHCSFILHSAMYVLGGIGTSGEVGMESVYVLHLINPSLRKPVLEHMLNDLCKESNSLCCWLPTDRPRVSYVERTENRETHKLIEKFVHSCLDDTLPLNTQLIKPDFQDTETTGAQQSLIYAAQVELAHAKQAFENDRANLIRLLERERSEIEETIEKHKKQNEMWWKERIKESNNEREKLRMAWNRIDEERTELEKERERLEERGKQAAVLLQQITNSV